MSMFHELMMRKKEQIMYATIKGTLTENDGVFSGFSASNYLEIPKFDKTSAWEMVYCFTTPNSIDDMKGKGILQEDTTTTYKTRININSDGTGLNFFATSNGTSFDIATTGTGATNVLTTNTKYFLKFEFTGTQYIWSLKSTGDYSVLVTKNSTAVLRDNAYKLGTEANNHFTGSIDLNKSYIKLGSTKYKLQAVVGYTVVGSPTITDGVVSGFSANDYLKIQKNLNITKNQDFEFCTVFSIQTISSINKYLVQTSDTYSFYIDLTSSQLRFRFANEDNTVQVNNIYFNLATDTKYKVKWKYTALTNTHIFTLEQNNNILKQEQAVYIPKTINLPILYGRSDIILKNIYINETYIKLNNKLFFNGQQA